MEDVIVVGSGPAAYTAALYASSKKPLLFEGVVIGDIGPGGQLTTTTAVDNYPGFPNGVQGPELMETMRQQALDKGVRVVSETVTKVEKWGDKFVVSAGGKEYETRAVIMATGASAKRLRVPGTGEGEFWQKGISACAICDGFFFKDEPVAIIGGGDAAMEEAHYMSKIASKVYLIHRRETFRARKDMIERLKAQSNVEFIIPAELVSAHGDDFLKSLKLKNTETGEEFDLNVSGLFFAIGHEPNAKFLSADVKKDPVGYIIADERMHTSVAGMFACGDVQDATYRQAVTAAASGCIAGLECCKFLNKE